MSYKEHHHEQPEALGDTSWLDEWADERKLTPRDAHNMLRTKFSERLAIWREAHPTKDSWVIPFYYTHEEADSLDPTGALWIPSDDIQNVIDRVGRYIHASAVWEMEQELFATGIVVGSVSGPNWLDLQDIVPTVKISRDLLVGSLLREQVEKDFSVIIKQA